jgi:hypothetical protein
LTPRPLYRLGKPSVSIVYEAGSAPEPAWTTWRGEKSCPYRDSNSDTSAVQPLAGHYTNFAIPASLEFTHPLKKKCCQKELGFGVNVVKMVDENISVIVKERRVRRATVSISVSWKPAYY